MKPDWPEGLHPVRPVRVRHHLEGPPKRWFRFVADSRNDPAWCSNVEDVWQTKGKDVRKGSTFGYRQHLGTDARTFEGTIEIIDKQPNRIVWRVEDKFQLRFIELSLEERKGGTRIAQTTWAAFKAKPGALRFLYPVMAKRTLKQQFAALAALPL